MALESWSFVSRLRGLAVALEGWGVNLSTSCLHFGSRVVGNGHGYKSSSPVLSLLEGEASWLESLSSNHILERWICGLAVESPIWLVYMALKPMATRIISMCVFFYSIWKYILYVIFSHFFKVKKSKGSSKSKECAMITFIFTTKIQQFLMFWHLCIVCALYELVILNLG